GIRDFHVTGVQTCALPIYEEEHEQGRAPERERHAEQGQVGVAARCGRLEQPRHRLVQSRLVDDAVGPAEAAGRGFRRDELLVARSEERRVGKECRTRWMPY